MMNNVFIKNKVLFIICYFLNKTSNLSVVVFSYELEKWLSLTNEQIETVRIGKKAKTKFKAPNIIGLLFSVYLPTCLHRCMEKNSPSLTAARVIKVFLFSFHSKGFPAFSLRIPIYFQIFTYCF